MRGLVILLFILYGSNADPLSPTKLPKEHKFDNKFNMKWNSNNSHIMFQLAVKTEGWLGFGISRDGGMFPSDVGVAFIADGKFNFTDRHTIGYRPPVIDFHQDWFLVEGKVDCSVTTVTIIRKLDTLDNVGDIIIKPGLTHVIYAYGAMDTKDTISYHGRDKGFTDISLVE